MRSAAVQPLAGAETLAATTPPAVCAGTLSKHRRGAPARRPYATRAGACQARARDAPPARHGGASPSACRHFGLEGE